MYHSGTTSSVGFQMDINCDLTKVSSINDVTHLGVGGRKFVTMCDMGVGGV